METPFTRFRSAFTNGNGQKVDTDSPDGRREMMLNRMEEIIGNALMGRAEMFKKMFDPRRDIDDECGFPKGDVSPAMYEALFARDAIAARVVEVLPEESWQTSPTVFETESTDDVTQFEDTWDNLAKQLRSDSRYQDEEGNPIWELLCRADKLSGIGQYGVILLGLDDGLPMNMPVPTWETRKPDNTYQGAVGGFGMPSGDSGDLKNKDINTLDNQPSTEEDTGKAPGKKGFGKGGTGSTGKKSNGRDVIPDKADRNPLGSIDKTPPNYPYSGTPESLTGSGPNPTGVGTDAQYQGQYTTITPTSSINDPTGRMGKDDAKADKGQGKGVIGSDPTEAAGSDDRGNGFGKGGNQGTGEGDDRGNDTDSVDDDGDTDQDNGLTPEEIELIVKGITADGPLDPEDVSSVIGETDDNGDRVDPDTGEVLSSPGEYAGPKYEPRVNLLYVRVFPQAQAQITQYERDIHSPRFGQPVMYLITFNDPRQQHSGTGLPVASQNVHWTRIIHIVEPGTSSSEVFGIERMRPVLNNLLTLQKLYGGSGEMYWRGAFPGYSLETTPQLGGDVSIDVDATRDMMEDYTNGLQRFLLLMGMQAKSLAPQVVDPTPQINVQIEAICIKLGIPIRVFKGSERGELASSQDDSAWNDRLKKRQSQYITPRIVVPFVDRLINIGVLPEPKGFSVAWKDLDSLSETDKATNANTLTTALGAYLSGGLESLITPKDYLVHICQFTDEQAEAIIEGAKVESDNKEMEQQQMIADQGFVPAPPEGYQHDPKNLPEGIAPDGSPLPPAPIIAGGGHPGTPGMPPGQHPPGTPGVAPPHPGMPPAGGNHPPSAPGKPPMPPSVAGKGAKSTGIEPGKFGEKLPPKPPVPGKPVKPGKPAFGQKKPVTNAILEMLLTMNQRIDYLLTHNYDPDQPRDEKGRFGSGGGTKGAASGNAPMALFPHALPVDAPPMALPVNIPQAIPLHAPTTGTPTVSPSGGNQPHQPSEIDRALAAHKEILKQKAVDLFTKGKAKVTGAGKAVYDKLPKPLQKAVDVGQAIEHGLEGAYHAGQKLAKEVAKERGGDEKHVERVAKWTALGDGVMRWTANIPVVHEALHVVAHIGGPVGFVGAKIGYYIPVASLAYIGYAMTREAVARKNPFAMVNRARKSMQAKSKADKDNGHTGSHH